MSTSPSISLFPMKYIKFSHLFDILLLLRWKKQEIPKFPIIIPNILMSTIRYVWYNTFLKTYQLFFMLLILDYCSQTIVNHFSELILIKLSITSEHLRKNKLRP